MLNHFIHLRVHSDNSILNGLIKVERIVKKAKEFNMPAVSLTDNGNLYGVVSFVQKCKSEDIKPIIGVELDLVDGSRFDKSVNPNRKINTGTVVLLAKNFIGYKNIIKLVSIAHLEGFYYKPRIDYEVLKNYSEGIILISSMINGPISIYLGRGDYETARFKLMELKNILKDDFYLEVSRLGYSDQEFIEQKVLNLSKELNVPIVATNDVYYENSDEYEIREVLWSIEGRKLLSDPSRKIPKTKENYFRSPEEMINLFNDIPEAISNTIKIVNSIETFDIGFGKIQPKYPLIPEGYTEESFLKKLVYDNLESRFGYINDDLKNRIEYELKIIHDKGYDGYFLVVWDVANWAKKNGVSINARGSAAGSCIAYALGITNVDPIKWGLYFERFLNPERKSFPDIDIDIADNRRDELINYVKNLYGEECVINVGALGKLSTRAAIRDVGRVLGIELKIIDKLSKLVPVKFGKVVSIKAMISDKLAGKDLKVINGKRDQVEEFRKIVREDGKDLFTVRYCEKCNLMYFDEETECSKCATQTEVLIEASKRFVKLFKYVLKIENCVRNISTHACGYLITAPNPVNDYVSVQKESGNRQRTITQLEGKYLEDIGLMKFDFLGLANLSIIDNACKFIQKYKDKNFDIENIPENDKKTFDLLKNADTKAVFQLESTGMRKYLKELKPDNLEEISAMLALYRPGPLEYIPSYINRKFGREEVSYLIPELEPIMKITYGLPVYQEQILQIASMLAGYSLGAADNLRRAIGKKLPEVMIAEEKKFKEGFLLKFPNYNEEIANKLWEYVLPFADYGFNKSHSAAYAVISYRTAYLKANYQTEFFASLMLSNIEKNDKLKRDIIDAKDHGIQLLPADINKSDVYFTIEGDRIIRFGIGGLKGVGLKCVQSIINERNKNGIFRSFDDFLVRINHRLVPKNSIEALIKIGALDIWGKRASLLSVLEDAYEKAKKIKQKQKEGFIDIFYINQDGNTVNNIELNYIKLPDVEEVSDEQKAEWESQILGVAISKTIYDQLKEIVISKKLNFINEIAKDVPKEKVFKFLGIIKKIKIIKTKKGEEMAFLSLVDITGDCEIVVFPNLYKEISNSCQENMIAYVEGFTELRNGLLKLIADKIKVVDKNTLFIKFSKRINETNPIKNLENNNNLITSDRNGLIKGDPGTDSTKTLQDNLILIQIDPETDEYTFLNIINEIKSSKLKHENGVRINIAIGDKLYNLEGFYPLWEIRLISNKYNLLLKFIN